MSISIIYIARGFGAGFESAKRFFDGYKNNPPGVLSNLYIVTKGWSKKEESDRLKIFAREFSGSLIDLPDDGYDWGAYMRVIPQLNSEWICLLNTHSCPISAGWLNKLYECAKGDSTIGACGATGSWGTWYFRNPLLEQNFGSLVLYPARIIKNLKNHLTRIHDNIPFPNPHLRSNALFLRRKLFMEFCASKSIPQRKSDSHLLESGQKGLSNFLLSRELTIRVVGSNGLAYGPESWVESETFRIPSQRNLLISDNQTRSYEVASHSKKRRLEYESWGRVFTA
jgi:hypothetical protein